MCGICGIVRLDKKSVQEPLIRAMMFKMKHRGPDDEGIFVENNVGFGFVRLSIIDLSDAGNQPMISGDGRFVLVYNGEIFNYIEIREELKSKGYYFTTQTDTEVLLKSYIEWKDECLDRFNGMWAFAIYDRQDKYIFAARDRYGIKPFYYYHSQNHFIFSSEISPILAESNKKFKPNDQAIYDFLVFNRTDQTEGTFFEGIKKLQHGHKFRIDLNRGNENVLEIEKWYDLRSEIKEPFKGIKDFRDALKSSINLRLRSDVQVGVCLSGGMDSSSIVSILLDDFKKSDLNTFSAVYKKGQIGNESDYIDLYKPQLKNMFFTTPDASTFFNDINDFIRAHSEPVPDTSPYAQFKVMELARGKAVVTLDGQGADELLGGYHYFFGFYFRELLIKMKIGRLYHEMKFYLNKHHSTFGLKTFFYFLLPTVIRAITQISKRGYLNIDFVNKHKGIKSTANKVYNSRSLKEALLDHFEYKLEHLLKWEDRNSMWFSLEARVPFLDHNLVEHTLSLPSEKFIYNGTTKTILREAMKGTLPEAIRLRQDKIGFSTPEDEWFRALEFRQFIPELLSSDSFRSRGYIDYKKCLHLYQQHLDEKKNISKEIWKWINLELWFREFID